MDKVIITKAIHGICHMIVCAEKDATDEEILDVCNRQNPSGTTQGWVQVIRDNKENPIQNPLSCHDHADRLHFMVSC